ncbi:hypothetical protein AKJ64_00560 [candidate division MSBL1 archaeon SCGC-AAA259E17]|uniref:DUF116 domain-containing protein n=1 Tax=candidate division MSBL1 archaeon SCGC-AAA259E17 TaxID=1698263 RepID=A0A133UGW3_9EURY|nr:hypothetical protein AKJ64_00560 [candidate division MSBL1 archaeon SCGC-AAA259E17]
MTYEFDFDLTGISKSFFRELSKFIEKRNIPEGVGNIAQEAVDRFDLQEKTGVLVGDALRVVNDMIGIYVRNLAQEEGFTKASDKALFLPHCSRKYMDKRCQAEFDPEYSTYYCNHCSEDCLVNKATQLGEGEGYDVYVLPGGSCIPKIMMKEDYEAVLGVACSDEIKLGFKHLEKYDGDVSFQGIPLLKNGCSNTEFNMETLEKTM